MLILAISIVGIVLNVWNLMDSGIAPAIWCIFPYILTAGLSRAAKLQPWRSAVLGSAVVMLLIDAAFFIETSGGAKSTFLLILSLLSTLKLITTFPAGAFIGYAVYKITHSRTRLITHH